MRILWLPLASLTLLGILYFVFTSDWGILPACRYDPQYDEYYMHHGIIPLVLSSAFMAILAKFFSVESTAAFVGGILLGLITSAAIPYDACVQY